MSVQPPNLATPVLDARGAFVPAWANFISQLASGVPAGGDSGQVLTKLSDTDNDIGWETITLTGGGA